MGFIGSTHANLFTHIVHLWFLISLHRGNSIARLSKSISTHWGRATHICVGNLTIIGSDNGLAPDRRQAIIWTNAGILLIGPLRINVFIQENAFENVVWKMRPFYLGLNVLRYVGKIDHQYQSTSVRPLIASTVNVLWGELSVVKECRACLSHNMMEWNLLDFNGSYFFILAYLRYLASSNSINIGPGNSFLPGGTKPLPEIMFASRK